MLQILFTNDTDTLLTRNEHIAIISSIAMVVKERTGAQHLRVLRSLPRVPGRGQPAGHTEHINGGISINAGILVAHNRWGPVSAGERLARLILTAAHEGAHAAQIARGEKLPDEAEALEEYGEVPWYEEEARRVSLDVLKGAFPQIQGGLPLGRNREIYHYPQKSSFEDAWRGVRQGKHDWQIDPQTRTLATR